MASNEPRIAIIIPCLNEEPTVGKVVDDFRRALPHAGIYVVDNGSTDRTASIAENHGARVIREPRRGKGFAVRTAFRLIDADVYVLADGDNAFSADEVYDLLAPLLSGRADVVVGSRIMSGGGTKFRAVNRIGNFLLPLLVRLLLRTPTTDVLSGYRAVSRQYVQQVPLVARGFEIEAEQTIKTIARGYRLLDVPITATDRPHGNVPKLRVFHDGIRILWTMLRLFLDYVPLTCFGGLGLLLSILALSPGITILTDLVRSGTISHLPSEILFVGLMLSAFVSVALGLILGSVSRHFEELEQKVEMGSAVGRVRVEVDQTPLAGSVVAALAAEPPLEYFELPR